MTELTEVGIVTTKLPDTEPLIHGVNCEKAPHWPGYGHLHAEDDDESYDVDGMTYCGRCHAWLTTA